MKGETEKIVLFFCFFPSNLVCFKFTKLFEYKILKASSNIVRNIFFNLGAPNFTNSHDLFERFYFFNSRSRLKGLSHENLVGYCYIQIKSSFHVLLLPIIKLCFYQRGNFQSPKEDPAYERPYIYRWSVQFDPFNEI